MVYYDHARRREGDVFTIRERDFSKRSMRRVDPSTPERITTGAEDLRKKHDEILGGRLTERGTIDRKSVV